MEERERTLNAALSRTLRGITAPPRAVQLRRGEGLFALPDLEMCGRELEEALGDGGLACARQMKV